MHQTLFFRNDQLGQGLDVRALPEMQDSLMYVEPCDRPRGEPAPANSSFLVVSLLWGTLLFGILLIVVRYAEVSKEETARPGVSPLFKQCFSGARGAALCFQRDVSTRRLARGGST